ncbi:hypothetical protein [Mycobacterium sp.]|uniref:hypothetical protein n=1 Tax=Mycobacterium sp. TaxID=1785 RepID=UPI0026231A50|nr:hypothetical protein [Mycobacterium sp.]
MLGQGVDQNTSAYRDPTTHREPRPVQYHDVAFHKGLGQTAGGGPQTSRKLAHEKPYDVVVADAVVDTGIESPAANVTGVDALSKFGE